MEKWIDKYSNIIPKDNYTVRLVNGEENGLTINLIGSENEIIIEFGLVKAIRMLDEGIVLRWLYSDRQIEKYKTEKFESVIYIMEEGEFSSFIEKISGEYWDTFNVIHYLIITLNYNIEVISETEPTITIVQNSIGEHR